VNTGRGELIGYWMNSLLSVVLAYYLPGFIRQVSHDDSSSYHTCGLTRLWYNLLGQSAWRQRGCGLQAHVSPGSVPSSGDHETTVLTDRNMLFVRVKLDQDGSASSFLWYLDRTGVLGYYG
jgi:hypothetical protein